MVLRIGESPTSDDHGSAEKRLLYVMEDLKQHIILYQHDNIDAYQAHVKLQQTYSLIMQLVHRCKPPTINVVVSAKKYNEMVLEQEGYSYQTLIQCCDRIIRQLYSLMSKKATMV
jgi:hypothetical protein